VKDEGTVPVTVHLPRPMYLLLARTARKNQTEVGPLIVAVVRLATEKVRPRGSRRAPAPARPWTPEEDSTLQAMHAAHASGPEIAMAMGRSNSSVSLRRTQLGLTPHYNGRPRKDAS